MLKLADKPPPEQPAPYVAPGLHGKGKRARERLVILTALNFYFPGAFGFPFFPLKIGIYEDILADWPKIDPRLLSEALGYHTHRPVYLHAVKAGKPRVNLDGEYCGFPTDDEKQCAKRRLGRSKPPPDDHVGRLYDG
jgi:sRNA-binding protein